jgi:hypothetical protein
MRIHLRRSSALFAVFITILLTGCGGGGGGDGGGSAAAPTPAAPAAPPTPPVIGVISSNNVLPLTPLQVPTTNLSTTGTVTVTFSNSAGFKATNKAIRVQSDGTVVVAPPMYIDPTSSKIGPGTVQMTLTQNGLTSASATLFIQDLPASSSYGATLGQITTKFLVYKSMMYASNLNALTAAGLSTGVNTATARFYLQQAITDTIHSHLDVDAIVANPSTVLTWGTLSDGTPLKFTAADLDLMDRILGLYLTQQFPANGQIAGLSRQRNSPGIADIDRAIANLLDLVVSSAHAQSSGGLLSTLIDKFTKWSSLGNAVTSGIGAHNFLDVGAAVTGGIEPFAESPNFTRFSGGLGILSGMTGIRSSLDSYFGNLNLVFQCASSSTFGTCQKEVDDLSNSGLQFANAEIQTIASISSITNIGNAVANAITNGISLGANLATAFNDYQTTGTTVGPIWTQAYNNVVAKGQAAIGAVANLTGDTNITFSTAVAGLHAPQYGVDVCCFGSSSSSIQGLVDQGGSYNLVIPVNLPNTNYRSMTVSAYDVTTDITLGSTVVDLSSAKSNSTLTMPLLRGACNDPDNDAFDDPDCD